MAKFWSEILLPFPNSNDLNSCEANVKRQNYQILVKNAILMSAKTVSSDIILLVNQKGNRLYDICQVAFSGLYF